MEWCGVVKPCGPDQCARCSGVIQALKTSARGALNRCVISSSRSASAATSFLLSILNLLLLKFDQITIQPLETLLPELAVFLDPGSRLLQRRRLQPARSRL